MRSRRSASSAITKFAFRASRYPSREETANRPDPMTGWPSVSLPALTPSISRSTVSAWPDSSVRMHRTDFSGLTQRRPPSPQRIDFPHGKSRIVSSSASATTCAAVRLSRMMVA